MILLGLSNHKVNDKLIQKGDTLTSKDVIKITTEVYASDRPLSLMRSISSAPQAEPNIKAVLLYI